MIMFLLKIAGLQEQTKNFPGFLSSVKLQGYCSAVSYFYYVTIVVL